MQQAWFALIGFLMVALVFSFLCSVLEAVVLSITPSFIASQRGRFARSLEQLKRDIDRPLAAILTLNTFAHTIGAAGVGAAAQDIWGEESLTVVSAVATVLILLGSEIVPKTIGAVYWRRLAHPVVFVTRWLTWLLWPVVWVCQGITRLLRRGEEASVLSRADLSRVANLGYRDGLLRDHERRIIGNLMATGHRHAREVMTPRDALVMLRAERALSDIRPGTPGWHVSRIPIYTDGDRDRVTSYVLKDEVLAELLAGHGQRRLAELGRPIVSIDGAASLVDLYQRLVEVHEHIAVVRDADRRVIGVVSMEDLIEELLGQEIIDESDRARGIGQPEPPEAAS